MQNPTAAQNKELQDDNTLDVTPRDNTRRSEESLSNEYLEK
jgi:hypothetical protein